MASGDSSSDLTSPILDAFIESAVGAMPNAHKGNRPATTGDQLDYRWPTTVFRSQLQFAGRWRLWLAADLR